MELGIILFLFVTIGKYPGVHSFTGCTVSINKDLGSPQTLVLKNGSSTDSNEAYYYPTEEDRLILNENDVINFACPGGFLMISGNSTKKESSMGICSNGSIKIEGRSVSFNLITCSKLPSHSARYTGYSCLEHFKEIEVGYLLNGTRFVRHQTICFDDINQNTLYTETIINKGVGGYQIGFPRPGFVQDQFYNTTVKVDDLYTKVMQRENINPRIGLAIDSEKYIQTVGDNYLARGHLSPKSDCIYGTHQQATFHYVNAAPQWQTFNGQNWNTLEQDVQDYVSASGSDHVVYTGTHGIATLPHEGTGEEIELFLYVNGKSFGLPVPEVYWKVLYNPESKAGVAFVGVNNPYKTNVTGMIHCTDITDQINWLTWTQSDIDKGYSYSCDVDELRVVIGTIPFLDIETVLT